MLRLFLVLIFPILLVGCVATVTPTERGDYFSERDITRNGATCRMVVDGSGDPVLLINSYYAQTGDGCKIVQGAFHKPIKQPVELDVSPRLVTIVWPTGVLRVSVNKFHQPRGKWTPAVSP